MDTMAALFEAVGLTPSAAAPPAAANDAAGEPSLAAPPADHAPSRLSFALPVAETPEPATTRLPIRVACESNEKERVAYFAYKTQAVERLIS